MDADFEAQLLPVNKKCLLLEVGLPSFGSSPQREANIMSVLLTFAAELTFLHNLKTKNLPDHFITFLKFLIV